MEVPAPAVTLRFTIANADRRAALEVLGADPHRAEIAQLAFFDTPDAQLWGSGIMVWARWTQSHQATVAVTWPETAPSAVPEPWPEGRRMELRVGTSDQELSRTCSLEAPISHHLVRRLIGGQLSLVDRLDADQHEFLARHGPLGVGPEDLQVNRPLQLLTRRVFPPWSPVAMITEMWLRPEGGRILELTTTCRELDAEPLAATIRGCLSARGVRLSPPFSTGHFLAQPGGPRQEPRDRA